jgi:RNA polymerase sigma-70 factor (ECF subfamily)
MLGSVADAEDVVQDARLKLLHQQTPPDNEEAWLFKVVSNLAVDRLRHRKRQRANYPGPWLPEPVAESDPAGLAELADELSLGLLLMLERLSPGERVVFVLREAFELGFDEIAELIGTTAASCRQRYRRARTHLAGEHRFDAPAGIQQAMLEKLLNAVAQQNYDQVVALFAPDAVAYADGGGVVSAAIRPVTDPRRIAQVTLHLAALLAESGTVEFRWQRLNGAPGVLVVVDGVLHSTLQLDVENDVIARIYIVRNPEKLARLAGETGLRLNSPGD